MRCFIDTNSLIHYQLFSEIDWLTIMKADSVDLVICMAVIKELDTKKFSELDMDIRSRCQTVIRALNKFMSVPQVRKGVSVVFLDLEPTFSWTNSGLSQEIPDDRIIASVLCDGVLSETVLVTADLGLILKARTKGIKTISLDDDLRIQVKPDKRDQEIKKLHDKVRRLESSLPAVDIFLVDETEKRKFVKLNYREVVQIDQKGIDELIRTEREQLTYVPPQIDTLFGISSMRDMLIPSSEEVERYKKEVNDYIGKLREYYLEDWKRKRLGSRIFQLVAHVVNDGTAPAEDLDIFLHFPDGFEMQKTNPYSRELEKPSLPKKPQSLAEKMKDIPVFGFNSDVDIRHLLRPSITQVIPNVSGPSIKKTNSFDVKFRINKLKHNHGVSLDPLYLFFSENDEMKSFEVDYKITVGNFPEQISGQLKVVFEGRM